MKGPRACGALLIGIEDDLARCATQIAHRHCFAELAPTCLGPAPFEHACLEDVEFRFRHRPLETEQQTIIVVGGIIHAIGIGNQRVEEGADLQHLMPVPA